MVGSVVVGGWCLLFYQIRADKNSRRIEDDLEYSIAGSVSMVDER